MTHFIEVFSLSPGSGTKPTVCLRYAWIYKLANNLKQSVQASVVAEW